MDGSLGIFIPIEEKMYKRLLLLQQLMTLTLKTIFSLNPRDFHTLKSPRIVLLKKKGFIDGRIIAKYESLPSKLQEELAQILGVTSYLIKINIREIENLSSFF